MKVEVAVLGSPSLIILIRHCIRKAAFEEVTNISAQELCVEVEVAVLGSPSLIVLMVSVDVKQH